MEKELQNRVIKYNSWITEEEFDSVISVLEMNGFGRYIGSKDCYTYKDFKDKGLLKTNNDKFWITAGIGSVTKKPISLSQIFEFGNNKFEKILAEAKERYPIGSTVKSLVIGNPICKVENYDALFQDKFEIWFNGEFENPRVYHNGEWAEIIKEKPNPAENYSFKNGEIYVIKEVCGNIAIFRFMKWDNKENLEFTVHSYWDEKNNVWLQGQQISFTKDMVLLKVVPEAINLLFEKEKKEGFIWNTNNCKLEKVGYSTSEPICPERHGWGNLESLLDKPIIRLYTSNKFVTDFSLEPSGDKILNDEQIEEVSVKVKVKNKKNLDLDMNFY